LGVDGCWLSYVDVAVLLFFFFSSRRRHTRLVSDWSSDVCSSDLARPGGPSRRDTPTAAGPRQGCVAGCAAAAPGRRPRRPAAAQIGRASCRERGEGRGGGGCVRKKRLEEKRARRWGWRTESQWWR